MSKYLNHSVKRVINKITLNHAFRCQKINMLIQLIKCVQLIKFSLIVLLYLEVVIHFYLLLCCVVSFLWNTVLFECPRYVISIASIFGTRKYTFNLYITFMAKINI